MLTKVTVQQPIEYEKDDEGHIGRNWPDVAILEGFLLPTDNEYARKKYGLTEEARYRFLFKGSNTALKVGNRIVAPDGQALTIVYVADYGRAMDVFLNSTVA